MKKGSRVYSKPRKKKRRPTPERRINDELSYRYTEGKEFTTEFGEEYIGEYHVRKDGRAFTGPTPPSGAIDNSSMLVPYYATRDTFVYDQQNKFYTPLKDHVDPQPYEYVVRAEEGVYEAGYDSRYFVQKIGFGTYAVEIDEQQRGLFGRPGGIDPNIYRSVTVVWQLVGTLKTIEETNKRRVNVASQIVPDLPYLIRSYTQYARPSKQTETGMLDALYGSNRKYLKSNKVKIKQTYDPETGRIIPPR